jgi:hypothetical protein
VKLTELEAEFIRYERRELGEPTDSPRATQQVNHPVDSLAEADGIMFRGSRTGRRAAGPWTLEAGWYGLR